MHFAQRIFIATLVAPIALHSAHAQEVKLPSTNPPVIVQEPKKGRTTKEILTDAAIGALIIAASIAAYKAMGKPCACPEDTMSNGRRCGRNSAWAKAGGYRPLCRPEDVTSEMITAYRSKNAVPRLK